jgi:hypothetical protein
MIVSRRAVLDSEARRWHVATVPVDSDTPLLADLCRAGFLPSCPLSGKAAAKSSDRRGRY